LVIALSAPPEKGRANDELMRSSRERSACRARRSN
jgi:uncharacterized protein YggU (UPF0235/DUF167 family)